MVVIDMKHEPPPARREAVARAGLASLKKMALADGPMSARATSVIRAVRDQLLRVDVDIDSINPISAPELAQAVPEPLWRERILRGMILVGLLDGDPTERRLEILQHTARTLDLDPAPVKTFSDILAKKFFHVQIDVARRSFIPQAVKVYFEIEGPDALLQIVGAALKHEDSRLAARYHTLDHYSVGTFGRAYADFITLNGFSYPGEVGGPPPPIMRHDCCHVLGGYGTTAAEECAVNAFQAGFEKADPFFVILFALTQFELGIRASPILPGMRHQADPMTLLAGLEHGTHVKVDLIGDSSWDPWDHFAEPLDDVRAALSIPPRGRDPEYAALPS